MRGEGREWERFQQVFLYRGPGIIMYGSRWKSGEKKTTSRTIFSWVGKMIAIVWPTSQYAVSSDIIDDVVWRKTLAKEDKRLRGKIIKYMFHCE